MDEQLVREAIELAIVHTDFAIEVLLANSGADVGEDSLPALYARRARLDAGLRDIISDGYSLAV